MRNPDDTGKRPIGPIRAFVRAIIAGIAGTIFGGIYAGKIAGVFDKVMRE